MTNERSATSGGEYRRRGGVADGSLRLLPLPRRRAAHAAERQERLPCERGRCADDLLLSRVVRAGGGGSQPAFAARAWRRSVGNHAARRSRVAEWRCAAIER